MKEIIEYRTVEGASAKSISDQVNDLLCDGWQPYGGVSITYSCHEFLWSQAMVKYAPNPIMFDWNISKKDFNKFRVMYEDYYMGDI